MSATAQVALLTILACIGLAVAWSGVRPKLPSLASELDLLYRQPTVLEPPRQRPLDRVGIMMRGTSLGRIALRYSPSDLQILGRTPEEEAARRAGSLAAGLASGPATVASLALVGIDIAPGIAVGISILGTCVGAVRPMRTTPSLAAARRRAYRWQLAMFLLAVGMCLSAGYGVETALTRAVKAGRGGLLAEMSKVIDRAKLHREPPWHRLRGLGEELGVEDLADVAENIALAGDDGARIRETVIAKADALMVRILTEDEAEANEATEAMHLPTVVLLFAFMAFTAVPAMSWAFGGLSR